MHNYHAHQPGLPCNAFELFSAIHEVNIGYFKKFGCIVIGVHMRPEPLEFNTLQEFLNKSSNTVTAQLVWRTDMEGPELPCRSFLT